MSGIARLGTLVVLGLLSVGTGAWADVKVSGAWARATMPGQEVAAVYMQLRSDVRARLVGIKTSAAKTAELHEMSNEGGVMRMRQVASLDLPAGKQSGLREAQRILRGVEGIRMITFTERDVVRHPLVQQIIGAYERDTASRNGQ